MNKARMISERFRRYMSFRRWFQIYPVIVMVHVSVVPLPAEMLADPIAGRFAFDAWWILAALIFQTFLVIFLLLERRRRARAELSLQERLRFETLLSDVSAAFTLLPGRRLDEHVNACLGRFADFVNVDRGSFWRYDTGRKEFTAVYSWPAPSAVGATVLGPDFGYCVSQLAAGCTVRFSHPEQLPAGAESDVRAFSALGLRSFIAVPLYFGGEMVGALSFGTLTREVDWPMELDQRLRILGEIFANAMVREASEDGIRQSEILNWAVLESLPGDLVIIDTGGRILRGNRAWTMLCDDIEPSGTPNSVLADATYLDIWFGHTFPFTDDHARLSQAVKRVLSREAPNAVTEYHCRLDGAECWIEIHIQSLSRREGGAVITHLNITGRKSAESAAVKNLEMIYHMDRVAAMGELATSLAHEINQPLAAISANAESALVLLRRNQPDITEAVAALNDIVEDDQRAGEVIRKMRGMLKKGQVQRTRIDINAITTESIRLVTTDALLRRVKISTSLQPRLPMVTGDNIQLQQVLLNLLSNAIQATADGPESSRSIYVRTRAVPGTAEIIVEVEDSGAGIPDWRKTAIFEPFFTTKSEGLGMGLPISRSIVEDNFGRLWVEDAPNGGALFRFTVLIA